MTDQHLTDQDYELLTAYLDGMLDEADRAGLEARLQIEPLLRRELNALRQTVAMIRALPPLKAPRSFALTPDRVGQQPAPIPQTPARVIPFSDQAREGDSRRQTSQRSAPRRLPLIAGLSAAAAAVVVLLGVGLLVSQSNFGAEMQDSQSASQPEVAALSTADPLQSAAISSNLDVQSNALPSSRALQQAPMTMMQGGGGGAENPDQGIPGEIGPTGLGGGGEGGGAPTFIGTPDTAGAVEMEAPLPPQATTLAMPTPTIEAMDAMDEAEEAAGIMAVTEEAMLAEGAQEAALALEVTEATEAMMYQESTPDADAITQSAPAPPEMMDDAGAFSAQTAVSSITQAMIAGGTRQEAALPSTGALRLPEDDAAGTIPSNTLGIGLIAAGVLLAIAALIVGRMSSRQVHSDRS